MYIRTIENEIRKKLFKNKVICLFGPRRSGKTTVAKDILKTYGSKGYYLNCENATERGYLVEGRPELLKNYLSDKTIIVLDEAQTLQNIGSILKLFVDTYPDIQLIATGSSSFDLANKVGEPLVGRAYEFFLSPLSYAELFDGKDNLSVSNSLSDILVYGSFPSVVTSGISEKIQELSQIANSYLYKDIFTFEEIKKPKLLEDLLKKLAFQIGREVSIHELAQKLEVNRKTIERYLGLLEKTFVIKRLYALKRNRRDEVGSAFKVYFCDNGVRNFITNSFNSIENRDDIGALFENYVVTERIKYWQNKKTYTPPMYFWRTYGQLEIDLIEEENSTFRAYECKWSNEKVVFTQFKESYPKNETFVIHKGNLREFLL